MPTPYCWRCRLARPHTVSGHGTTCRCGQIPLLFQKGCPKGGVVIWMPEFLVYTHAVSGCGQRPYGHRRCPYPGLRPPLPQGRGIVLRPLLLAVARTFFTLPFFLLVFNMRNLSLLYLPQKISFDMVLLAVAFWILIVLFVIGVISYVEQIAKGKSSSDAGSLPKDIRKALGHWF